MLLIFTQSVSLIAQEENKRILSSWKVAIVGVVAEDFKALDSQTRKASLSVIPLLQTLIKEGNERQLSTKELFLAREYLQKRALYVLGKQLIEKQNKLDTKNLQETEGLDIWNNQRLAEKEIHAIEQRIKKIRELDTNEIPVNNKLPIELLEDTDIYHITPTADLNKIAQNLGAQELLYYTVQPLNQFIVISLHKYLHLFNDSTQILRTIVKPTDVQQLFNSIAPEIRTAILGVPSASIKISALSQNKVLKDAKILLDSELIGFGEVYLSAISAGTHAINIIYQNQQRQEVIVIDELENISRTFFFSTSNKKTITILTKPSNAKVYINSEWVGNSPVVIPQNSFVKQLEVVLPEYKSKRLTLNYLSPKVINLTLEKAYQIPLEERLKKERNDFYLSFAIMGASILPPLILYGLYLNEANTLQEGGASFSRSVFDETIYRRDAYFYSSLGTSALTVGAVVWFSFELTEYLKVGNEFHER